jgi:hypothetical protein
MDFKRPPLNRARSGKALLADSAETDGFVRRHLKERQRIASTLLDLNYSNPYKVGPTFGSEGVPRSKTSPHKSGAQPREETTREAQGPFFPLFPTIAHCGNTYVSVTIDDLS